MEEYDEYANLMSQRDKQWLIGIQLMQLNTETPYIDDFYYTVYKERQKRKKGDRESRAHKANTMNHPLTQPKTHAHFLMMSMGKNGTNQRHNHHMNGHHNNHNNNRERKNSEKSDKDQQQTPRTYTPLQFENSLGKLQCGSVTAPRKIIDMDIVGPDMGNQLNPSNEISTQRRSRQLLLHIETLYKIVLKLEDLKNPTAIAAALIVKEKKDKERQLALEQAMIDGLSNDTEGNLTIDSILSANDKKPVEPETVEDLLPKLIAGLTSDKVITMMNVRKGKVSFCFFLDFVQFI